MFGFSPVSQCPMPNALCPMPYAQCPMPNALCPMPHAPHKTQVDTADNLSQDVYPS
ncbi:hypothetical protein [Tolypothrix sp. PCC 7601]|uniref:hypothetical protein n=1 Tax=Tolypothrix sp. PCC 7601 TaxID=1188 RepID=UPI001AF010A9|nr:hypothetical protein [Tolypothrix sp. PCC 7601]